MYIMPHRISDDLHAHIPILHYQQYFTVKEICKLLSIKKTLVYQSLKFFHQYGVPQRPTIHTQGQPHILSPTDIKFIQNAVVHSCYPLHLDELQHELLTGHHILVSFSTLCCTMRHMCFSHKDVSVEAKEQDKVTRNLYMGALHHILTCWWGSSW